MTKKSAQAVRICRRTMLLTLPAALMIANLPGGA